MPGKRIYNSSLVNTTFTEAVANNAELLTDWGGLVWARPIPISLIGNAWWQGSYDGLVWDDSLKNDHIWAQASTDGGVTWLLFNMAGNADAHPAVSIGTPTGGLSVVGATQVLTLNPATNVNAGSMAATDKAKIDLLKDDYLENIAGGFNIYKDYTDEIDGLTRTHILRPLVGGVGVTLSYVGDTISIAMGGGSGEANTGANVGSLGQGVYDGMNGTILNFRNIHSAGDILTVTLDNALNNIALEIVEANIDHDSLENYVADQHVDHTTVEIATSEGITGGGDLTATRTLTLAFDELSYETTIEPTDTLAFYRTADDLHYAILYEDLELKVEQYFSTIYVPLTTQIIPQTGLTGGGALSSDVSIGLGFNNLPTVAFDPVTDYIAIYDASNGNHAKVLVGSVTSVNISAGVGMNFANITGTGTVTMGTPSTLTEATTNQASGTTHTHVVDLSTWELDDLGDVPAPTALYYLRRNALDTAYEWVDPAIGASAPGAPSNSIQFNNAGAFGGNAGLLYDAALDTIFFSPQTESDAYLYFGDSSLFPFVRVNTSGDSFEITNPVDFGTFGLNAPYMHIGTVVDNTTFLSISDSNATALDNVISVFDNTLAPLLVLDKIGQFYLPELPSATSLNMLYFDTTTGKVTYGAKPTTAGGVQTLVADSLSGLMVNGGSTSSASSIELDANDNKLTEATIASGDYIGFYDITDGIQKKTTLANLPGWNLYLNGVSQEAIKLSDTLDFVAGTDMQLLYNSTTNELTVNYVGGANPVIEDIAFDFNDVTTGVAQTYILDIKASYDYIILSCVLQSDDTMDDVAIKINGTAVTSLSAIDVTTAISDTTATALNNVAVDAQVTLVTSGTDGGATLIRGKLRVQRV